MSMSPDDPNFLQSLLGPNGSFSQGMNSPLMGIAMGLLQAGGPSRMPVSFGQALGQGMQTGQQFQQQGLQNAMQRLMLGRTGLQMNMLQDAMQPNQQPQTPQPQQATMPPVQGSVSQPGSFDISQGIGQTAPAQASTPQAAPTQQPLARFDPYQDQTYLKYQKLAQTLDMIQPGSGAGYAASAQQRLQDLNNQQVTYTGDQTKQFIPGGALPGQSIQYHPATGEWSVKGDPQWKDITYTDSVDGQTKHILWNQATNQFKGIPGATGSMPTTSPTGGPPTPAHIPPQVIKAYPGIADTPGIEKIPAEYLPMVSKIAAGEQDFPTSAKRSPVFEKNLTDWVTTINPNWKEQNYATYGKQMASLSSGEDAKKLDPLNTIEGHLDTYKQAMAALNNGNMQLANKLGNSVGLQMGKGPQAAVLAVKQLVAGELGKAVAGGTVTEGDRDQANAVLNSYNSPEQTEAVLKQIQALIGGKIGAIRQRYAANGLGGYFDMRLNKPAFSAMNDAGQTQAPAASTGLPQGWSVQVH